MRASRRVVAIAAVLVVAMLLSVPASPATEEAEGVIFLAPVAVFGIGAVIGFAAGWLANDYLSTDGPVYDSDKLAAELRENEASWITTSIEDASIIVGNALGMTTETWRFTNAYWQRQAEVAVADQWSANGSMDAERILELSGLRSNSSTVQYNWALLAEAVPGKFSQVLAGLQDDAYSSMRIGISWNGGSLMTDGDLMIKYGAATIVSGGDDDRVYLDNRSSVYVIGGNARIESSQGSYALTAGENNISSIPSGIYELQAGRMYVGGLAAVIAEDAADINAGLTAVTSSGMAGVMQQGGQYAVWHGSAQVLSYELRYVVQHEDDQSKHADLRLSLSGYQSLLDEMRVTAVRTVNAGQVMWMVFDAAGSSTSLISPSAIMPQLENLQLSTEQQYLVYLSAMKQIGDWYSRSSSAMQLDDLTVSPESLELVCRGAVYDSNGVQVLGPDAIWTPMVYLRDQPVPLGASSWAQTGLVMVWGSNESLSGWEGGGMPVQLIEVTSGYSFQVEEILYRGNETSLVVLQVMSYTQWAQIDLTPVPDPIIPPASLSLMTILGVCALLVAAAFVTGRYKGRGKAETIVVMKDARVQQERRRMDKARRR